jgi:hypothetical protein
VFALQLATTEFRAILVAGGVTLSDAAFSELSAQFRGVPHTSPSGHGSGTGSTRPSSAPLPTIQYERFCQAVEQDAGVAALGAQWAADVGRPGTAAAIHGEFLSSGVVRAKLANVGLCTLNPEHALLN